MPSDMGGVMTKYAIIENETVINVIDCEESFIKENDLNAIEENEKTGIAKIGAIFVDGKFDDKVLFDDSALKLSKEKEKEIIDQTEKRAELVKILSSKLDLTEDQLAVLLG